MKTKKTNRSRAVGIIITLVLIIAVFSPLDEDYRGAYGDSFPLSWYPMFSRSRPKTERTNFVRGIDAKGKMHILRSHYYVRGGMNQARRQLSHLVKSKKRAKETCVRAAANVAKSKKSRFADWKKIQVVRGYFNMRTYFEKRKKKPLKTRVFASCLIKRDVSLSAKEKL